MTAQRERFNTKIREMRAGRAKNVTLFSDMEYHKYLSKMDEFKNPVYKIIPYDFSLLKRFEILKVEKDGDIIERLVKPTIHG